MEIIWNSVVESINGEGSLDSLTLKDTVTGETSELPATGLFTAIRHEPRSELLLGQVDLDHGYVLVQPGSTATNIDGVFVAGDLVDHTYRQAITAAGIGCSGRGFLGGRHRSTTARSAQVTRWWDRQTLTNAVDMRDGCTRDTGPSKLRCRRARHSGRWERTNRSEGHAAYPD